MAKGGRANDDGVAAEVLAVAKALRLTHQQLSFTLALAADPERNQTNAAMAAGCTTQPAIQGSRWARMGKIQTVLGLLTAKAAALVERKTLRAIASKAEVLEYLTTVTRARTGDYLKQGTEDLDPAKVATAPEGLFRMTPRGIEQESPAAAAATLLKHYEHRKDNETAKGALVDAIRELPPEFKLMVLRRMLSGPATIEIPARVLPS